MKIRDYYRTPEVRSRMIEFFGGQDLDSVTSVYIGRCRDNIQPGFNMRRPDELDVFLGSEWDVARSLWDRKWLLVDLDIEYTNFEFPAEPFLDYQRTFSLQEPILRAVERILSGVGIRPLHAISGRGHHFVWKVQPLSEAFQQLTAIGRLTPALEHRYTSPQPPNGETVGLTPGKAFAGLGLVIEYLAQRILVESQPECPIPVLPEAVDLGPQQRGREMIAVDISEYGDPLHTRAIRTPFSIYLKPWQHPEILTPEIEGRVPAMVMVPGNGLDIEGATAIMRDLDKAAEWASQTSCLIPDGSHGMEGLIALYHGSELRAYHDWYYSQEHEPPERWPFTYDRTPLAEFPPHIRHMLEHPNDLLLKPSCVRQLVAFLLEQGWHPRHIAGLIRSKYERDYGWLNLWYFYDAGMRADYHARVLAGLMKMGYDQLADLPAWARR